MSATPVGRDAAASGSQGLGFSSITCLRRLLGALGDGTALQELLLRVPAVQRNAGYWHGKWCAGRSSRLELCCASLSGGDQQTIASCARVCIEQSTRHTDPHAEGHAPLCAVIARARKQTRSRRESSSRFDQVSRDVMTDRLALETWFSRPPESGIGSRNCEKTGGAETSERSLAPLALAGFNALAARV